MKVWVINESVAKTLNNRTFEMNYLEHQIKRNKIKARRAQEVTEKKDSSFNFFQVVQIIIYGFIS